jgi:transketolase
MDAAKIMEEKGVGVRVINMCTIKPLDNELVLKAAKETGRIITAEEHSIIGGLGEAVSSLLSEQCPTPVKRVGVNDTFGHSGPAVDLLKQFGLSAEHLVEVVEEFLK